MLLKLRNICRSSFLLFFLLAVVAFGSQQNIAEAREKSSVILIFNNQAEKYYNAKLNAIAEAELHKKIDTIYIVKDSSAYNDKFKQSHFGDKLEKISEIVKDSGAKYFVYTELMPYHWSENFNFIWHTKKMTATMGLRIIDLERQKEILNKQYSMEIRDETDYFIIGNPSMAKKSLKAVLFKVGEAISAYLPL
ncbi:MAG: hypothetical protein Q4E64_11025 [Phascolarctobacterium sp.]|uniref:hypothetical protein n=1 Tax=Phascolarctobacterium sp. TaxID=2049039 RepID=UPI0026DC106E|nr:hypothetical protein [Phascolarctobacterium sp.]MDO4922340.1 hypothetical protein [Phascolarctobacterium sp.]